MKAFLILFLLSLGLSVNAQGKKDIKKLKIKSATTTTIEIVDGKEKVLNDTYQRFDKEANVLEDVEYNKDGVTFKKKESRKLNKNEDVTEEIIYDEKGNVKKKTLTEYNAKNDKTIETVYDGKGAIIEKITYGYNSDGNKNFELTSDASGKTVKKAIYTYSKNGLKAEKKTYNANGDLISTKKYTYEF